MFVRKMKQCSIIGPILFNFLILALFTHWVAYTPTHHQIIDQDLQISNNTYHMIPFRLNQDSTLALSYSANNTFEAFILDVYTYDHYKLDGKTITLSDDREYTYPSDDYYLIVRHYNPEGLKIKISLQKVVYTYHYIYYVIPLILSSIVFHMIVEEKSKEKLL